MAINKIVLNVEEGEQVLVDLTGDTVMNEALVEGYTAHGADGELIAGTNPYEKTSTDNEVQMQTELLEQAASLLEQKAAGGGSVDTQAIIDAVLAQMLENDKKKYPVGYLWISTASTSPADILGFGTWERIQDRFLLAAGSDYAAGTIGGESAHKLTANELPAHTHVQLGTSGGAANSSPVRQVFQGDGNVVVYSSDGTAVWATMKMTEASKIYRTTTINQDGVTGSTGSDAAHNNMPPYLVVYMWKRTA